MQSSDVFGLLFGIHTYPNPLYTISNHVRPDACSLMYMLGRKYRALIENRAVACNFSIYV